MIDKNEFIKELDELQNEEVKEHLLYLYQCYLGKKKCDSIKNEIKNVLSMVFKNEFTKDIIIPYDFLNTAIGKVLFTLQFCKEEKQYSTKEIVELTGFTKQYIHQEIQNGNLVGYKKGGRWYFTESDVRNYLKKKGKL